MLNELETEMLHDAIARRRSPRAFDPLAEVTDTDLQTLLEAARWAPSAMNRQPWRFLIGRRGDATFKGIADSLSGNNQLWAPSASALIVALVDNGAGSDPTDPGRAYELGLAVGQLGVQAVTMGLITHQMGGFDGDRLRAEFAIPDVLRPLVVLAAGYPGDSEALPAEIREREHAPRQRKALADVVQREAWVLLNVG